MTRSERSPRLHAAACILIAGGTGLLGGIFGRAADPPAPAAKPAESAAPIRREPLVIRDGGTAEEPAVFDGGGLIVDLGTDVTDEAWRREGDLWTLAAFAGRPLPIMAGQYAALFVDDVPIVVPRDLEGEARHPDRRSRCYLAPNRLAPGQAGFTAEGGLVFRWPAGPDPATARLVLPPREGTSAVTIACSHVIVRNITATHAANDGFNIHGGWVGIVLEDVRALCNGDEGISAHDDIQMTVRRAEIAGNGSASGGVADVNRCVTAYEDCVLHDNVAAAFHFSGRRHTVARCRVYRQSRDIARANGTEVTVTDLVWERDITPPPPPAARERPAGPGSAR